MHFLYIEFLYYVRSEIGWCISTEVDKALGKSYENDSISMSQHETYGIQIDSMQFKPYSFQTSLITGCWSSVDVDSINSLNNTYFK